MSTTLQDLLTHTVDAHERQFADHDFAAGHARPIRHSIQTRRAASYASVGGIAAALVVGATFGVRAWAMPESGPASGGTSGGPGVEQPQDGPTVVNTALVPVPMDESIYEPDETSRAYVYFASFDPSEMGPFPPSGLWYPGIPDVPTDAFIVNVSGDVGGYDADAPGSHASISGFSLLPPHLGDLVGNRSNASGPIMWEVDGYVSSHTTWQLSYYVVDGSLVSVEDGKNNPDATLVIATHTPLSDATP